jgi:hypothetical protein
MRTLRAAFCAAVLLGACSGDVYVRRLPSRCPALVFEQSVGLQMHSPRGSNNKLNEAQNNVKCASAAHAGVLTNHRAKVTAAGTTSDFSIRRTTVTADTRFVTQPATRAVHEARAPL